MTSTARFAHLADDTHSKAGASANMSITALLLSLQAFTRCAQQEPDNGEAWNNIAAIHLQLHHPPEAFSALSEAVKYKRDSWQTWSNYGQAAAQTGNSLPAARAVQKASTCPSCLSLPHKTPESLRCSGLIMGRLLPRQTTGYLVLVCMQPMYALEVLHKTYRLGCVKSLPAARAVQQASPSLRSFWKFSLPDLPLVQS